MGAFGIRLRSFLKVRWENLTMAEVINASVLFQLASQDQRFERVALTSDIKTEDQFLFNESFLLRKEEAGDFFRQLFCGS